MIKQILGMQPEMDAEQQPFGFGGMMGNPMQQVAMQQPPMGMPQGLQGLQPMPQPDPYGQYQTGLKALLMMGRQ